MTNLPVAVQSGSVPAGIMPELEAAVEYTKAERAPATRKAYGIGFRSSRRGAAAKEPALHRR
jgi:hypothetical protein